jgi:ribonuclease PH
MGYLHRENFRWGVEFAMLSIHFLILKILAMETTMRQDKRAADQLRSVSIEYDAQPNADGSVLIRMGGTHVLCGVSVENKVPPFLVDTGTGWITA